MGLNGSRFVPVDTKDWICQVRWENGLRDGFHPPHQLGRIHQCEIDFAIGGIREDVPIPPFKGVMGEIPQDGVPREIYEELKVVGGSSLFGDDDSGEGSMMCWKIVGK